MTLHEAIIERVVMREGSKYVVETMTCSKFGVTREKLSEWRGTTCSCDDVKALTKDEAVRIYLSMMGETRIGEIVSPALCELLFDGAVNCGPGRAVRWLQRAIGAEDDGLIGAQTLARIPAVPLREIYGSILDQRIVHHGRIATADPDKYARYMHGWAVRCGEFVRVLASPDGVRWTG